MGFLSLVLRKLDLEKNTIPEKSVNLTDTDNKSDSEIELELEEEIEVKEELTEEHKPVEIEKGNGLIHI